MDDRNLFRFGALGTLIAALCCFSPLLVVLLGAIGLSSLVGWLDYVLLPALLISAGVTVYALVRRRRRTAVLDAGRGSP